MADINLSVPYIPGDNTPERDALHVPVFLVTAKTTITPGCRLTITREGDTLYAHFINPNLSDPLAPIANPFLRGVINAGTKFYALLPPGSDVNLTHQWTSPKVPNPVTGEPKVDPRIAEFEKLVKRPLEDIIDAVAYAEDGGCRGCY